MNKIHFSSKSDDWKTPVGLFNKLNTKYSFELDAAASEDNAKCLNFYTEQDNALLKDWSKDAKSIFLNPPYGRQIHAFVKKAYEESLKGCVVVCLIPARVDTQWWYNYVRKATKIVFLTGRLKFSNSASGAPFPSCIIVFDNSCNEQSILWEKTSDYKE